MRGSTQIKEMLVAKFLAKISLSAKDSSKPQATDAEVKIQSIVSKEFEKFIVSGQFTQKNLDIFEKGLRTKLNDYTQKELNVVIKSSGSQATTHRVLSQTPNDYYGLN